MKNLLRKAKELGAKHPTQKIIDPDFRISTISTEGLSYTSTEKATMWGWNGIDFVKINHVLTEFAAASHADGSPVNAVGHTWDSLTKAMPYSTHFLLRYEQYYNNGDPKSLINTVEWSLLVKFNAHEQ